MLVELGSKTVIQALPVMFRRTSTPSHGSPTRTGPNTMSAVRKSGATSKTLPINTTLPETSNLIPRWWKLFGMIPVASGRSRLTKTEQ